MLQIGNMVEIMLLVTYFEKKLESTTKEYDKIGKKYDLVLNTIDNLASGLEGIDPLKGKLKVFYTTIIRRYVSVITSYLNKDTNIDSVERSQIKIILKIIVALAYNIRIEVLQYIAMFESKDKKIIKKQKKVRKNVILKTYLLFKLIEQINVYFNQNERYYKRFINYVYSKIFDLFEREGEVARIYKNDEKYFKSFPTLITGLRSHKALENIISSNKRTEKEDKKLGQLDTYYLNHQDGFNFIITPIVSSQFYINDPTPFDFLIQKQGNTFKVISTELYDISNDEYDILVKDLQSKNSLLSSMFNIKNKNNQNLNLKDINNINKINVLKLGNFNISADKIEGSANKQIDLTNSFSNSKLGEIEIES